MTPSTHDFKRHELEIIRKHRTPASVQRFLRELHYNWEEDGKSCMSFRGVVRRRQAHCLEAAITAAVILEQYGYPPLVVSMESQDKVDHVIFVFEKSGRLGAVARSRDLGLHGRHPVFRTVRDLVMSYFDPYVDKTARITGYALADLRDLGQYDWRLSDKNVWKVERYLQEIPHREIRSSDARYEKWRKRYIEFRKQNPDRQLDYFPNRHRWML
jgi:hypothetical protein